MQGIPSVLPNQGNKLAIVYELVEQHFIKDFNPIELFAEQRRNQWYGWNVKEAWTPGSIQESESIVAPTHDSSSNGTASKNGTTSNSANSQSENGVEASTNMEDAVSD
jgi:hypothetical protein